MRPQRKDTALLRQFQTPYQLEAALVASLEHHLRLVLRGGPKSRSSFANARTEAFVSGSFTSYPKPNRSRIMQVVFDHIVDSLNVNIAAAKLWAVHNPRRYLSSFSGLGMHHSLVWQGLET
jgi:hypothetical protein